MGRLFRFRIPLLCCLLAASAPTGAAAQCADWAVAVANVQPSSCFASGSFTVELSGSRLDSLSGIRYSLPGVAAYAQGQTSPSFTNMPQGTYTVLVEAMCGAANVAKSAQVAVAGSYTPPTCAVATARNSLGCAGGYGKISVSMGGSSTPRTVKLLSAPAAYAGATAFTTSATSYVLADLPAGEYLIQVVDNCGQSTATQPVSIRALDFSKLTEALNSLYLYYPFYPTWQPACNTYYLTYPSLNTSAGANPEWIGYDDYDTPIRWQVGFVGQPLCAPKPLNGYGASYYELLALPAGKTFKDYYGVDFAASPFLEAYVTSPCGSSWQLPAAKFQTAYATGAAPVVTTTATAFCGRGFCWNFELSYYLSIACYPISIRIASAGAGAAALVDSIVGITSFGTYTTGTLPFGDYLAYITTADGQTFTKAIAQADAAGNPYVGTFANGVSSGLSGRAYSIAFHRRDSSAFPAGTTIELVDTLDAAGYGYTLTLSSNYHGNTVTLYANDGSYDPAQGQYAYPQVAHFPPGRYYFRISDGCGQYALEATAADSDVYRYSISLRDTAISCQGLVVKPTGTAARGASTYAPYFKIICGPGGYDQPTGYDQRIIGEADSFILQAPGTYIIMVAAAKSASYYNMGSLGNSLVVCDTVVYEEATVALDMQATQGFVCIGAGDSEGQIVARATGGTAPYRYALYPSQEAALTGTGLIAENATGAFASTLGLRRSATYYLMLTDACSRQSLQSIRVLNLSSGMLAWADKATLCLGEAIALHAVTMPSTRYAWEGPNGFTSAAKDTVLPSAERAHAGSYRVRLSSTACPSAMESTPIAIAVRRYATAADIALDSFALCRGELLRLPLPPRGDHPAVRWYASQSANDAPIDVGSWLVVADTSLYVSLESDTLCENPAGARKRVRCTVKPQAYTALRDTTCQGQPYTGHGFALPPQDTSG
ncbi:MAG: hypothetical protein LBS63_00010, partial [Prevotellaceae bacterium]|nr:hypothetical protein [Prevotellaceae bacterium]